jgi:uncharacterized membrane protein
MREPDLPDAAVPYTRKVTWVWVGFFVFNGACPRADAVGAASVVDALQRPDRVLHHGHAVRRRVDVAQALAQDVRVNNDLRALPTRLASTRGWPDAHAATRSMAVLLVLNADGINALRQHGRQTLLEQMQTHPLTAAIASPLTLARVSMHA